MKRQMNKGVAIVSVLYMMTGVMILALVFILVTMSEQNSATTTTTVNETLLAADSLSERARITLLETYNGGNYSIGNFLETLQKQEKQGGAITYSNLHGTKTGTVEGIQGRWVIRDVQVVDNSGWVEVAATSETAKGSQTVIRRVGFGDPEIFQLAMLTETVNCMFCHLRVNGDVGTLDTLRPGWGDEVTGSLQTDPRCWASGDDRCDHGWGSGASNGGSIIDGNVFAARDITDDDADLTGTTKRINGTEVTGAIEVNSRSNKLPKDVNGDNVPDFPEINREKARASAKGKINSAATMIGVPLDGSYSGNYSSGNVTTVDRTYNGNLILIGTAANPIDLSGDIFVEGDIVIKGAVKGIGALYSGRNIYFAGDVTLQNPPDPVNTGVCAGISDPDACAKKNIQADKDVLRTGARGNIVIGDYTEYDANGDWMPWSQRQSSDFYRSQFGFWDSNPRYYDKTNGDELEIVNGQYVNADRVAVSNSNVKHVDGWDSYTYSMRPGAVEANGQFNNWLSDGKYQQLLGNENFDYNTWRTWVNRDDNKEDDFEDTFKEAIQNMNLTISDDSIEEIWDERYNESEVNLKNAANQSIGRVHWDSGGNMRVIISATATYETQINRIDAFLYANQRIAGKTSMQAIAIEGGMIAKEIGVLAPGRRIEWPFNDNYTPFDEELCSQETVNGSPNPYYVEGTEHCALTLNYDYRLRNGGYGFNLVTGEIGKTLSWRVAESSDERVAQ